MSADPHYPEIAEYLDRAKAVIIVPQLLKAGLIIAGEGGEAVALAKRTGGGWAESRRPDNPNTLLLPLP